MNWPGFERSRPERVVEACARGLMPLRTATFVSLLVHSDAVREFGLPLKQFFIWSDDIEYTARVTRHRAGYLVPDSVALHKTASAHTATTQSGSRFYFHVRNTVYMLRSSAWELREKPSLVFLLGATTLDYLRFNRFSRDSVAVVARGLRDGLGLRRVAPDGRPAASSASP